MDIRVQMGKSYQDGLSLKKHKLFLILKAKWRWDFPLSLSSGCSLSCWKHSDSNNIFIHHSPASKGQSCVPQTTCHSKGVQAAQEAQE